MSAPLVIVPVRGIAAGKSRLASILTDTERAVFNEWLLVHTLAAVRDWRGSLDACLVVSACERALGIAKAQGAGLLREGGVSGLNAAASAGARHAAALGAASLLILPCDLPLLDAQALAALACAAPRGDVTIAPDESGTGTNALIVPTAGAFEFRFGADSRTHHAAAAAERDLDVVVHRSVALAFDVDTPEDYARWRAEPHTADAIVRNPAAPP